MDSKSPLKRKEYPSVTKETKCKKKRPFESTKVVFYGRLFLHKVF
jgi:hypothetical protein